MITMDCATSGRNVCKLTNVDNEVGEENGEAAVPKRWTEEEKEKIFHCLKVCGHKDLDTMSEELPGRSKNDIRKFLLLVHSFARQGQVSTSNVKYWLNKSISETEKCNVRKVNDFYQSAQIMKFLSIDGLLEDHPDAENSEGIDFLAAYRLLYQVLMGYPVQPVNQLTANFIIESLIEVNEYKHYNFTNELIDFLKKKFQTGENGGIVNLKGKTAASRRKRVVYVKQGEREEVTHPNAVNEPPLKVIVEEATNVSNNLKSYSLAIGDNKEVSTVVVPVVSDIQQNELEDAVSCLWGNVGFNPLGLSGEWFRLPSLSE